VKNLYDGVPVEELHKSAILAARALMEKDPAYSQVTARILLPHDPQGSLRQEVAQAKAAAQYVEYFPAYIAKGIAAELLDPGAGRVRPGQAGQGPGRRPRPAVRLHRPANPATTATSCI